MSIYRPRLVIIWPCINNLLSLPFVILCIDLLSCGEYLPHFVAIFVILSHFSCHLVVTYYLSSCSCGSFSLLMKADDMVFFKVRRLSPACMYAYTLSLHFSIYYTLLLAQQLQILCDVRVWLSGKQISNLFMISANWLFSGRELFYFGNNF